MLERKDLARFGPPGYTLAQKEKDYVQHWLLAYLARSGFSGVFKGGTSLQKAYGLDRYSEDLDFTATTARMPDWQAASAFLSAAGFSAPEFKTGKTGISESAKLRIRGPLYMGKPISECVVQVEISLRETVRNAPSIVAIRPPYPDLAAYQIRTMDKPEIAAEKIRALMTRRSARDLYDLAFLFRQEAVPDVGLVNEKLAYYEKTFNAEECVKRIQGIEKIWKTEMSALVAQPPDYTTTAKAVLDGVRAMASEKKQ